MTYVLKYRARQPRNSSMNNAYVIMCNMHDTACSFLDIFEKTRRIRGARGAPTNEEQDLLRAMLVFTASGLDSMIKQLVRDTLAKVIKKDNGANGVFRGYVEDKLMKKNQLDIKLLVKALSNDKPTNILIREVIADLTNSSLQSKDELFKVAAFFNIPSQQLSSDFNFLKLIFDTRNQIIHEMDIDFSQANRRRRPRTRKDMIRYTEELLHIATTFLDKIETKL